MMAKHNDDEMNVIDEYYIGRESSDTLNKPNINDTASNFQQKFERSMTNMDKASEDPYNFDLNILDIISKGEVIKEKKERKEFIIFVGAVMLIIAILIFLTLAVSEKIFLYYQIAAFIIVPFTLIPLANSAMKREA